jgi:branched-chain amino acid transport system permease protein
MSASAAEPPPSGRVATAGLAIVLIASLAGLAGIGANQGVCPSQPSVWLRYLVTGLILGFMYAMIALGYSMVYGVLKLLNFAHSEVFMIGSFAGLYTLTSIFGISAASGPGSASIAFLALALCAALVFGAVASAGAALAIERIAYRPLRRRGVSRLGYLITAIGLSLFLQNLFLLLDGQRHLGLPFAWPSIAGANAVSFPQVISQKPVVTVAGVVITRQQVLVVVVGILMLVALERFVYRSRAGQRIRAVAEDPDTASLMGINTERVIMLTFVVGGLMAGAAGVLYGMYYAQAQFNMGWLPGIKAFTAAVLGGIGNVRGAVVGGLMLGLVENLGAACTGIQWQNVIVFGVLVLVLMFKPTGLLGERVREGA